MIRKFKQKLNSRLASEQHLLPKQEVVAAHVGIVVTSSQKVLDLTYSVPGSYIYRDCLYTSDLVVVHKVLNTVEDLFVSCYGSDLYAC